VAWPTKKNVRREVDEKLSAISTKIDARRSLTPGGYEHQEIARIVGQSLEAATASQRERFSSSVGIDRGDEDRETWSDALRCGAESSAIVAPKTGLWGSE
jgi:hypothetical protein